MGPLHDGKGFASKYPFTAYRTNKDHIVLRTIIAKSSDFPGIARMDDENAVLVMPFIDKAQALKAREILCSRARHPGLLVMVEDDLRLGFIMVANIIYCKSSSPFFGYLAQDAYPGEFWLKEAMSTITQSGAGLLPFNDGRFFGTLAVFGLVRRAWLNTIYHNLLFFPGYKSHFGDTELTTIAVMKNQSIFNPNCLLIEVDYEKHNKQNNLDDERLYRVRASTGFNGLIEPFTPSQAV
jgi:hypothetical protein